MSAVIIFWEKSVFPKPNNLIRGWTYVRLYWIRRVGEGSTQSTEKRWNDERSVQNSACV